jgi:hypothetical protein
MTDPHCAYRSRLVTHEELIARMKPGDALSFGTWMGGKKGTQLFYGQKELRPLFTSKKSCVPFLPPLFTLSFYPLRRCAEINA